VPLAQFRHPVLVARRGELVESVCDDALSAQDPSNFVANFAFCLVNLRLKLARLL
jgi:hypothetical protein